VQVYDETMREALDELGISASGIIEGELNVPLLRQWLRKLRAVATHPQVGRLGVREKILGDEGHLKTIAEVLKVFIRPVCNSNCQNVCCRRCRSKHNAL
jgi:E3 ubiquitin-protein ligase SHPRH